MRKNGRLTLGKITGFGTSLNYPGRGVFLLEFSALAAACGNAATPGGEPTKSLATALSAMTVSGIQAEMDRVAALNRVRDFSAPVRPFEPAPIGIDARNGRVLACEYICWDIGPNTGSHARVPTRVAGPGPGSSVSWIANKRAGIAFAPTH